MTTTNDNRKKVHICIGYTNMYYIKKVIEHVRMFCSSNDYKVVENADDADLHIDVYFRLDSNRYQITYNINGLSKETVTKSYII